MNTKPKYSILEAKTKLEAFCAYQERCAQEVVNKLSGWGIYGEDQDILLADLISNNFLNESRFAEAYAQGKFRIKKWGKTKIKSHLKAKKISNYSINQAINSIDDEDYQTSIEQLAIKKWPQIKGQNRWEKANKLKRYLYAKGYESELLTEVVKPYISL